MYSNRWIKIQERILEVLKMRGRLTTSEVGKITSIHYDTARRHLEMLEYYNKVEHYSNGKISLWGLKGGEK